MAPKRKSVRVLLFLLVVGIAATALDVLVFFPRRPARGSGAIHRIEIPSGIGPKGLAERLSNAGLCDSPGRLALWLRLSGRMSTIKAGTFDAPDNLSPMEIVAALSGRTSDKGIKVVIPEGFTLSGIARALEDAEVLPAEDFLAAATDKARVKKSGFAADTFEGFLFPDTYYFSASADPDAVIRVMTENFLQQLKQAGIAEDANLLRTVILASIVQAEARVEKEMPVIAGVYLNRMTSPDHPSRLLQADPSVSYGCLPHVRPQPESCLTFKGILGRKQLDDDTNPYNTYKHPGLPKGPICEPGIRALVAAHRPKSVPYLYFVAAASGNGTHVFSRTLAEHEKAVDALRAADTD